MTLIQATDGINWKAHALVRKWEPDTADYLRALLGREPLAEDFDRFGIRPDAVTEAAGNLLVTTGLTRLTSLFTGAGGQAFNNAQAIVGVGSVSTGALIGDTHLGGDGSTSTAYYQGADATYPTTSGGLITCYSTFTGSNGNFAWNEWCWAVCTGAITPGGTLASVGTSPVLINHRAAASLLGTKVVNAVWQLQSTVTIS